jgi:hypothetical protein
VRSKRCTCAIDSQLESRFGPCVPLMLAHEPAQPFDIELDRVTFRETHSNTVVPVRRRVKPLSRRAGGIAGTCSRSFGSVRRLRIRELAGEPAARDALAASSSFSICEIRVSSQSRLTKPPPVTFPHPRPGDRDRLRVRSRPSPNLHRRGPPSMSGRLQTGSQARHSQT